MVSPFLQFPESALIKANCGPIEVVNHQCKSLFQELLINIFLRCDTTDRLIRDLEEAGIPYEVAAENMATDMEYDIPRYIPVPWIADDPAFRLVTKKILSEPQELQKILIKTIRESTSYRDLFKQLKSKKFITMIRKIPIIENRNVKAVHIFEGLVY